MSGSGDLTNAKVQCLDTQGCENWLLDTLITFTLRREPSYLTGINTIGQSTIAKVIQ